MKTRSSYFLTLGLLALGLLGGCQHMPAGKSTATATGTTSQSRQDIVRHARQLIGTRYKYGGKSKQSGFDCSGMVSYVYKRTTDVSLNGRAADMARKGSKVPRHRLQAGDLVFFNTTGVRHSHVGIYIGNNHFIHAPRTGQRIRISRLDSSYYRTRFEQARTYL